MVIERFITTRELGIVCFIVVQLQVQRYVLEGYFELEGYLCSVALYKYSVLSLYIFFATLSVMCYII